jgi:hypothetical protein
MQQSELFNTPKTTLKWKINVILSNSDGTIIYCRLYDSNSDKYDKIIISIHNIYRKALPYLNNMSNKLNIIQIMLFKASQNEAVLSYHDFPYRPPIGSLFEVYPLSLSIGWYPYATSPKIERLQLTIPSHWVIHNATLIAFLFSLISEKF